MRAAAFSRSSAGFLTTLYLGASQALLLKKIEELTLYLIEMQKENDALRERVVSIEGRVRQQ